MITWLIGENSFEIREALQAIIAEFNGIPERFDGSELKFSDLPDLLMGMSLFATERLVIITDISTNATVWEKLSEWLPRINETIHVVFIDAKPDKRTSGYKALAAVANVRECAPWTDRDTAKAQQWVGARVKALGATIDANAVKQLVERVGPNQWQLAHALDMLSLLGPITKESVTATIPAQAAENIFELFASALEAHPREVAEKVKTFALQEDPYALFALLSSQALSLAAITFAEEDDTPTKDFAIHPFVASKMARHAKKLGKQRVARIEELFAQTDADMKRSKAEPWILIEKLLLEIATIS